METLIGIIRRLDGPAALICHGGDVPPLERKRTAREALENMEVHYELREYPLTEVDPSLVPERDRLLDAWRDLTRRKRLDDTTLEKIELVLRETIAAPGETPSPPLDHRDLPGDVTRAVSRRGRLRRHAVAYLFDAQGLDTLSIFHGDAKSAAAVARMARRLPRDFILHVVPPLFRVAGNDAPALLRSFHVQYWQLTLNEDRLVLATVVRLIAISRPAIALAWLEVLNHQPRERRCVFLTLLIETNAHLEAPPAWWIPRSNELNWLMGDELYAYRLLVLFSPDGRACSPDYLLAGFRLANRFAPVYPFSHLRTARDFDQQNDEALMNFCLHLENADGFYREFPLRLWQKCARLPGLASLIGRINWRAFAPDTALALIRFFMDFAICSARSWEFAREAAGAIQHEILRLPDEYHIKAVDLLNEAAEYWEDEKLEENLPAVFDLMSRLCAPPFARTGADMEPCIALVAGLPGELRGAPARASTSSLRSLEKICASSNRAPLAAAGLFGLASRLPRFVLNCFDHFAARLTKSAELLGSFSEDIIKRLVHEFAGDPIMLSFENEGCLDLDRLRRWSYPRLFNPIPRRLLAHYRGEKELNPRALRADLDKTHTDINLLRLEVLDDLIRGRLAMGIRGGDEVRERDWEPEHSLRMLRSIDSNIRVLRRFLRAHARGDRDYIRRHPANRAWLSPRPDFPRETWNHGAVLRKRLRNGETLRLAVEQNPDEVLKMGTYFDTCLGLGGVNAFSAAAVLLDVNKQIVYARDAKGRVLGRQLLAVSEEGRLVCFEVYSSGPKDEELVRLFKFYDRRFARRLGMPLHDDEHQEYKVRLLVATEWYDDGVWVPE